MITLLDLISYLVSSLLIFIKSPPIRKYIVSYEYISTTTPRINPKPNFCLTPHTSISTLPPLPSLCFIILPSFNPFMSLHKMTPVGSCSHVAPSVLRSFDRVLAKMGKLHKKTCLFDFHQYTYLHLHVPFFPFLLKIF